jgi:hypothetical protein
LLSEPARSREIRESAATTYRAPELFAVGSAVDVIQGFYVFAEWRDMCNGDYTPNPRP